jgi:2-aminoadipate transaminase
MIQRMVGCGLKGNEGGANPFVAHVVATFCREGWLEPHIARLVARYRARRDALLAALEREMPDGVRWTRPTGGFFVWLTLPEPLEAEAVLAAATERGVLFTPGVRFFAEGGGRHNLRLPFSFLSEAQMAEGVRILAEVIKEQGAGEQRSRGARGQGSKGAEEPLIAEGLLTEAKEDHQTKG